MLFLIQNLEKLITNLQNISVIVTTAVLNAKTWEVNNKIPYASR